MKLGRGVGALRLGADFLGAGRTFDQLVGAVCVLLLGLCHVGLTRGLHLWQGVCLPFVDRGLRSLLTLITIHFALLKNGVD